MREATAVEGKTKVCPCCGEVLFADMDVCYGCLYDFSRKRMLPRLPDPPRIEDGEGWIPGEAPPLVDRRPARDGRSVRASFDDVPVDSLPFGNLDGGRVVVPMGPATATCVDTSTGVVAPGAMAGEFPRPDALSSPEVTATLAPTTLGILVRTGDVEALVPLPQRGMVVGRGLDCDLRLLARTVSRHHVLVTPTTTGAVVQDLGATNPAVYQGERVEGTVALSLGESVFVCGSELMVVDRAHARPRDLSDLPTTQLSAA